MNALHPVPADDSAPPDPQARAAELLRLSARGDEAAFAELYDATSARVHGMVLRVIRNPAQADEVTQEVFLEIWRTASRFDADRGSAMSWLMTIAHRKAVDRVRSAEASTKRDTSYHQENQPVDHDATAEAAHASIEAQRVRTALESLSPMQNEALRLAYFGGYTHTEVAAMLGLPLGTAKTRIRDGLIRLRDAMGGVQPV
ncbi:ECF RNA polymerase sigma factor SigK [Nocardioides alkalitolerans]|uniref:ECF RNA polymerase sigma factor SigK n=1 Tax=Nocardioides alkalitolerans TaxID=281714 RepID=UPI000416242D|nr:ECF RNA polymerase sigma factor SigK [Nocardioides alkalitolerans]